MKGGEGKHLGTEKLRVVERMEKEGREEKRLMEELKGCRDKKRERGREGQTSRINVSRILQISDLHGLT